MRFQPAGNLLALGALVAMMPGTEGKTCLMLYQMADNNLEYYLRQDYEELTNSAVVGSPDLRTWIYYDALNQGGDPLPNTVDSSGSIVTDTFTGSRYMTYDPAIQKMRIDVELSGEQDSDTVATVQNFLEHALTDCVAAGFDSYMAVFSSHGGGFAGYGGDENQGRRGLLQTNQNVVQAITSALGNVPNAPTKLDVIGFDACLMQAVGAADDYKDVTNYILASEAVEPGHGWAYNVLPSEAASSALELSKQISKFFISETQGGQSHRAPKTMAILNTDNFGTFITAFESLSADLTSTLKAGDISLHTFISRARAASVAFEGIVDVVGSQWPSGLDIGSFLENFKALCNPSGAIGTDLETAINAYNNMFEDVGIGEGTAAGTGMHITWPAQSEFDANAPLWDQVLFSNVNYATSIIPEFKAFLEYFLPSVTLDSVEGDSVCGESAIPAVTNTDPDVLILSEEGGVKDGLFKVEAEISPNVAQMAVEYSLDLSTPLKPVLREKGYEPTPDEYLYLLGGDLMGEYKGSKYEAKWDQNFYFLNISGVEAFEALYVFDQGDGSKRIPAMYFPDDKREQVANLQFLDFLFFDFDYWVEEGAKYAFISFSEDEADGRINDNLSLFTVTSSGTFAETPRSDGGLLIPLIYIDALIQGRRLTTLPGGFNQTVVEWSENIDYNVLTTSAERIFDVIPDADAVVVNMYAYDHGESSDGLPDFRRYDVIRPSKSGGTLDLEGSSGGFNGAENSGGFLSASIFSSMLGLAIAFGIFVSDFL